MAQLNMPRDALRHCGRLKCSLSQIW